MFSVQIIVKVIFMVCLSGAFAAQNGVRKQAYYNLYNLADVTDVLTLSVYPDSPSETTIVQQFSVGLQHLDNFANRFTGFFKSTQSGNHTFYAQSDNWSLVWIRDIQKDKEKKLLLNLSADNGFMNGRWDSKPDIQTSSPTYLKKDTFYFIEAVFAERDGGDFFSLGVKFPNGILNRPISAIYLFHPDNPIVWLDRETQNVVLYENVTSSFICNGYSATTPSLQKWLRNDQTLVTASMTGRLVVDLVPKRSVDNGAVFKCSVTNDLTTSSVQFTASVKHPFEICNDYETFPAEDRLVQRYTPENLGCDLNNLNPQTWYRFISGYTNAQLPSSSPSINHCGGKHPAWVQGDHPSIRQGVVRRTLCVDQGTGCDVNVTVSIRRCPGFHVYKFDLLPKTCDVRICAVHEEQETTGTMDSMSSKYVNQALTGFVLDIFDTAVDSVMCMKYCQLQNGCVSVNYQQSTGICELNSEKDENRPGRLVKKQGFIYYEMTTVQFFTFEN